MGFVPRLVSLLGRIFSSYQKIERLHVPKLIGNPLPENEASSIEFGKLKLDKVIKEGFFLAPKSYYLKYDDDSNDIKQKGLAKDYKSEEWFKSQYEDTSRKKEFTVERPFYIYWRNLNIVKINSLVSTLEELIK